MMNGVHDREPELGVFHTASFVIVKVFLPHDQPFGQNPNVKTQIPNNAEN
jgi:hypothetical protein